MSAKSALACYTIFILAIFILAYQRLLPLDFIRLRWFDSAGHFVLYGLWGYFFALAFPQIILEFKNFKIAKGILLSVGLAIGEETLQLLSPNRSFTFSDMAFSLLGICIASLFLNFKRKTNHISHDIAHLSAKNDLDRQ